jgi:hypothetical protein
MTAPQTNRCRTPNKEEITNQKMEKLKEMSSNNKQLRWKV